MRAKRILLTAFGVLLLGLGGLGVFFPILPATPFLLAASACFAGSPRMRSLMLSNKFLSEHLTNYQRRTGLKKKTVIISLGFLWSTMLISMFASGKLWFAGLLFCVGIAVTVHILCVARPREKFNTKSR